MLGCACGFVGHGRGFVTGFGIVSETYVGTDCGSAYHTRGSRTVVVERCNAFVSGNEWKLCIRQAAVLPTEASSQGSALSDGGRRLRTALRGLGRTGGSGVTICA